MADKKMIITDGDASGRITLRVSGQDNAVVEFRIKKHTALEKLKKMYCDRANIDVEAVRFLFDGKAIRDDDTPTSLDMEEGDRIDVYQGQIGGQFDASSSK